MENHEAELYIFGPDDQLITTITEETGLYAAPFKEGINQVSSFTFTVDATAEAAAHVVEENQVVFRDKEGDFRLFVIKEPTDRDGPDGPETEAVCEPWYMELKEHIVLDRRFVNQTADVALNAALERTRATGRVIGELGRATTNFYRLPAIDAIWEIPNVWGGELKDVVEFDGSRITARRMELHMRRGADRGKVFEIDHDIEEIERTVLSYPLTAMYGWGASLEIEDEQGEHTGGYTRYIDFADVEWSKAKGDPVDKPKGQKWVGDPDALQRYGRLHNGKRLHREGQYSNHDIEDPAELLEATWLHLQDVKEPEVNYRLSVALLERLAGYKHEHVQLGDTAAAIDREFSREIVVQSRVISIEYDILDIEGTAIVEMGQFLSVHDQNLGREIDDLKAELDDTRAQANRPITNDRFLDIKPGTPSNLQAVGGFQVIQLYWSYDSNINIAHYEVYGSQVATFVPDSQHLLYRGRTSAFAHNVRTDEVWYYYVRAVNQRGTVGDFSPQVSASSQRVISDDILFGEIKAEHLSNNLDIADKLAQNTVDRINAGPMKEIGYTRDEIIAAETRINTDLTTRLGDVNSQIADLLSRADRVDGTLITVDSEIDRINGSLSITVEEIQHLNGTVSAHSTTLQQHAGQISAKAERSEVFTKTEINTALGKKVDTTVYNTKMGQLDVSINGITGRVASTETNINTLTGQMQTATSNIAALNVRADGIVQSVSSVQSEMIERTTVKDTRSTNQPPSFYWSNHKKQIVEEFKTRTVIGAPGSAAYGNLTTHVYYSDRTGGPIKQEFRSADGLFERQSASDTAWTAWREIEDTAGAQNKVNTAVGPLNTRITSAEASIKTLAGEIELRATKTTVDSIAGRMSTAEGRINVLSDEIDLRVTKNGIIAGINITPESIRINGAKIHLTGQTLIDDAIIGTAALANAAVTNAKIGNLAVSTGQIQNGAITNAKIGNLAVDDAKIASLSATKLIAGTLDTSKVTVRGGSSTSYTRIDGPLIESRGQFTRTWQGKTATHDVIMSFRDGYFRASNAAADRNLYYSDFGISTYASGNQDESSGTIEFFSYDYHPTRKGLTISSVGGVVALRSGLERVIIDAYDHAYIRSNRQQVRIQPRNHVAGNNTFTMHVVDNGDPSLQDGILFFGSESNPKWSSGIRFSKQLNSNTVSITDGDGGWGTGNLEVLNLKVNNRMTGGIEAPTDNAYAYVNNAFKVVDKATGNSLRDLEVRNAIMNEVIFGSLRTGDVNSNTYIGVGSYELRVTNNQFYNGGNTVYRAVRASAFNQGSSRAFKTDIQPVGDVGLEVVRSLRVVDYMLKEEAERGLTNRHIGFIAEDSAAIATSDKKAVNIYAVSAYNTKAIKELDSKQTDLEGRVSMLEFENQHLKQKIKALESA